MAGLWGFAHEGRNNRFHRQEKHHGLRHGRNNADEQGRKGNHFEGPRKSNLKGRFDVAEIVRNKLLNEVKIGDINIYTEHIKADEENDLNVSAIEIPLKK